MRILVVDDSRVARAVLKKVLGEIGYSIVNEASDGAEALAKLREADFDLVITDWSMPRLDGIGLVRAIAKAPDLEVPVLMVSGETYTTRFVEVIRAGAQGYLPKPFTADALRIKIAEIAKKQELKREGEAATMSGRLAEVGCPELVQFVSSCALTGRLVIQHDEVGVPVHGLLEVRNGNVVAAYCGEQAGDEAVYAMAEWDEGIFRFQPDARAVVTNTTMPTLTLLMEAMKRRDERAVDASR
jgi:two-component system chemotaxis response regulator CheY